METYGVGGCRSLPNSCELFIPWGNLARSLALERLAAPLIPGEKTERVALNFKTEIKTIASVSDADLAAVQS